MRQLFKAVFLPGVLLLSISFASGQAGHKCGFDKTLHALIEANPAYEDIMTSAKIHWAENARSASKNTVSLDNPVIPVVFHVILTDEQIRALGGNAGIEQRIMAQMDVVNRDFNAGNEDSANIPGGFKDLFGNANISFALAHTAPDGSATPGFEIITTERNGFNLEGGWGSGFGFSGAKYVSGGGINAWDVESYLNIWIINPLENASPTNILGLAIPAYLATGFNDISPVERGIVLHYGAFGNKNDVPGVYITGSDLGRTLTHEVGHYFELLHIWGDDEGKCPFTGGEDDGIDDTPPQAYPSEGCSEYPEIDGCTRSGDGIMFMNYMDYSNDLCLLMFTHQQAARMRAAIQPGANAYSLTQQPWLLNYPDPLNPIADNDFVLYPNPADNILNISFRKLAQGLKSIHLVDIAGRIVTTAEYERQSVFYSFKTQALQAGMYFVVLEFDSGKEVRKVLVR